MVVVVVVDVCRGWCHKGENKKLFCSPKVEKKKPQKEEEEDTQTNTYLIQHVSQKTYRNDVKHERLPAFCAVVAAF